MSKREQNTGKHGEQVARSVLNGLGLEMIEEIGTPVKLVPVRSTQKNVYFVIWGDKVAGDHRAMFPNGRSVLIEVKTIRDRNLVWSDLREHQPAKLQQHNDLNGLSLLVWVHDTGVYVMQFPVVGFRPGKGITPAQASVHHANTVMYIEEYLKEIKRKSQVFEMEIE
jgi:penicillin-binding protein-related factor A (putative recombinase)